MKNKFFIKIVILAAAVVACCLPTYSQMVGFAGQDKEVMINEDQCFPVKLGVPVSPDMQSANTTVYFHWRIIEQPDGSEGILDKVDIAQPTITVSKCGQYICECVRISKYGYQTEYVMINVVEDIEIVSIESNVECYAMGQQVNISDFNIETNPAGYGDNVELLKDPTIAERNCFSDGVESDEIVYFKVRRDDGTTYVPENNKATINVVDNSKSHFSVEFPLGNTLGERIEAIEKAEDLVLDIENLIRNNKLFKGRMKKERILHLDVNITYAKSADCCDNYKKPIAILDIAIAFEAGYHVYIPVFTFVGFDVGFTGEGSFKVKGARVGNPPIPKNQCSAAFNMSYTTTVTVFGKIMATLIPPTDTFSISGGLKGYAKLTGDYIPEPVSTFSAGVSATLDVVALITIFSCEWNIVEGSWQILP